MNSKSWILIFFVFASWQAFPVTPAAAQLEKAYQEQQSKKDSDYSYCKEWFDNANDAKIRNGATRVWINKDFSEFAFVVHTHDGNGRNMCYFLSDSTVRGFPDYSRPIFRKFGVTYSASTSSSTREWSYKLVCDGIELFAREISQTGAMPVERVLFVDLNGRKWPIAGC